MKKVKLLLKIIALLAIYIPVKAQTGLLFYNTDKLHYSSVYNPSFSSGSVGLTFNMFPLAGSAISYNNMETMDLSSQILFDEQINIEMNDLFQILVKQNFNIQQFETTLLDLGYHSNFGSFSFMIRDRANLSIDFHDDLSEILLSSYIESPGNNQAEILLSEFIHFREYSLGYANSFFHDRLSLGFRVKKYYGKSSMYSDVYASVSNEPDGFFITSSGLMKTSNPATIKVSSGEDRKIIASKDFSRTEYMLEDKNQGMGFDFGFRYLISPRVEISGSVTDLGTIKWNSNLKSISVEGDYQFTGNEFNTKGESLSARETEVSIVNSLTRDMDIEQENVSSFERRVTGNYYMGLKYIYNDRLNFGVVNRFTDGDYSNFNSILVSVQYNLTNKFLLIPEFPK